MSRKRLQGSNGNISSFRGRGLIFFFILATLAAFVWGPGGLRPAAANDAPVISGTTATYSGNQQPDPINPGATISTNIYTINVNNLTSDVGSNNTSVAISLTHSGAEGKDQGDKGYDSQALTLNYDGGSHSLISKDASADVETTGGKGHSGGDNQVNNQRGGDGGDGGTGGTVNSSGVLTGVTITTTSGAIQALGTGISASSTGGNAGYGGNASGVENQYGGAGGSGGDAGAVSVTTYGAIQSAGIGIQALSTGGKGGYGGDADTDALATGGAGGAGGAGGTVSVNTYGAITTTGVNNEYGIQATSQGGSNQGTESSDNTYGQGGQGGGDKGLGGDGGDGGAGGQVNVTTHNTITTFGGSSHGIYAQSLGGAGGAGGEAKGTGGCKSGAGGAGGMADTVTVTINDWINTSGANAYGINAQSTGGSGGDGGECNAGGGSGNTGGTGGTGGAVTVTANAGAGIKTQGANAIGINAASTGGSGGDGGSAKSLGDGDGGAGGAGGGAETVRVNSYVKIQTTAEGSSAYGIYAQSSGGAGGAGAAGLAAGGSGGAGGAGGAADSVTVSNHTGATINTTGPGAYGIYAQSLGGAGGAGGASNSVSVTNDGAISTSGASAHGVYAQSSGGAGGAGGQADAVQTTGGAGGDGGAGGSVSINKNDTGAGTITTTGANAVGIMALSTGGAGGKSGQGNAYLAGGNGGAGGAGGSVSVTNRGAVSTGAAMGIDAESTGGAGQDGGAGYGTAGNGGIGGGGGASSQVTVQASADITTNGQTYAINAVSQAGAGGKGGEAGGVNANGGNAGAGGNSTTTDGSNIVSVTVDSGVTLKGGILAASIAGTGGKAHSSIGATAEGGDGGDGGASGAVQVQCNGSIDVNGVHGILAQSIAGIGGAGGDAAAAGDASGKGGAGAVGGAVTVTCSGDINVTGNSVHGILAQSQGGSGGSGGNAYGGIAVPENAGASGVGGAVNVTMTGGITTTGADSCGILAQSLGGSGGGDGYGIISWGQAASAGADGGAVTVNTGSATANTATISTQGASSIAILAQSIGGGGGNGGSSGSLIINLGGSGAAGGDGGNASVINYLALTTVGDYAYGIQSQSLGGGGGNGGGSVSIAADAGISIGGSGGPGGDGGQAGVTNSGAISTSGTSAHGIFAQSVGGGGGSGGYAVTAGVGVGVFGIGGSGGSGGDGSTVSVTNSGSISTSGASAYGILAQSVGGGGNGGWSVAAGVGINASIGGSGGSGGDGGAVNVFNSGSITTGNDLSQGILAQSIGGGGNGGFSVAAGITPCLEASFSLGGGSGDGGDGGKVTATSTGKTIGTSGDHAVGILAQSIGGGGGNGGWSVDAGVGINAGIGGSGGNGGAGGEVDIGSGSAYCSSKITTAGVNAQGILAQSVGGGGGNGNGAFSGNVLLGSSNGFNADITVGGKGGNGGAGNNVTVTNGDQQNALIGMIQTSGHLAPGILAQSIGGGGGNGGQSVSLNYSVKTGGAAGDSDSKTSVTINPSFNIGGNGGSGGSNKNALVKVENYANILTAGARSYGIQAQCIGGGGGNGGGVFTLALGPDLSNPENTDPPATNLSCNVTVGGNGGKGGDAGQVQVDNYGAISTQGAYSYGIFAQSVGGGGGDGGSIDDLAIVEALSKVLNHSPSNDFNHGATISVGGKGKAAGDGNTVTVNNYGVIGTSGDCAHGIFAQSVGGGGGDGGVPTLGLTVPSGDWSDWQSWLIPEDLSCEVGGAGGAAGDGNTVTVTNSGAITTSGIGAMGIYAQRVGGGGGVASYDQSNGSSGTGTALLPGTISIGGDGGSAGDGGDVSVTNSGVIQTGGRGACGIYAQSIGGGGGNAGVMGGPWEGINWLQYFGFGTNIGSGGGDGGNGGQVTVTGTADITTQGNNANGIFAQSIGGQGGSGSVISQQPFLWNGSTAAGVAGTGGTVTVSHTGNITTSGNDAHGIVAQSSAGKNTAGNVTVTFNNPPDTALSGNIITSGLGSCGIVAQSLGLGGNGQIEIDIYQHGPNTGLVQGGHSGTVTNSDGSTTNYNAYGVLVMDGNNNLVKNYGSISTLDGVTGTAIMQQTSYGATSRAALTIDNYGTITGSIDQGNQAASALNQGLSLPGGQSVINFNNCSATYNAGPVINLGGGTLTNSGLLSLGTVQSTLTGNYTQTSTGTFQTMVNGDGTIGQLNVSGTANLAGTLQVLKGTGPFKDGTSSPCLTGNTSGNFSTIILPPDTSLVNFSVKYGSIHLISNVKSFTTVATSSTHSTIAGYLDQLLASNTNSDISRILAEFQNLAPSQFRDAFASLHPGVYAANTDATFSITRQFNRTLQQRLEALRSLQGAEAAPQALSDRPLPLLAYNGSNAEVGRMLARGQDNSGWSTGRLGFWIEGFGQWGSQGSVDGVSGFNYGLTGTGIGVDYAFTKNLILGANFSYSYSSLNMDNNEGNGKINSLYGSLYGTYFTESAYLEGVFSYGNHRYDNSRRVSIGSLQSSNQSSHTGNAFAFLAEGGYKFPVKQWNLQPFASLSYCNLSEGRVVESGGVATMQVSSRSTDSLVSELGVQVDRPLRTSKGTLVPMVKASWQHDYGVSKNSLPFSLIGAPEGVAVTHPRASQDRAVVRAGLTFKAKGGVTSSIQYMGEVGEKTQNHGVIGQIRFSF